MQRSLNLVVLLLIVLLFPTGCVTTYKPGTGAGYSEAPPDHAKAYGYRAKHRYNYHPEVAVYFDLDRQLYFYLESGKWATSVSLPSDLKLRLGESVTLEIGSERPYKFYDEHRKKYPPGQSKKKKKNKKSHWKEDKYDD